MADEPLPPPRRPLKLPDSLGARVSLVRKIRQESHALGDWAANQEARTSDRRPKRRFQSLNKAARACGTACEASFWLMAVVDQNLAQRSVPLATAQEVLLAVTGNALHLIDDLKFEAVVINGYMPEARPAKRGRR